MYNDTQVGSQPESLQCIVESIHVYSSVLINEMIGIAKHTLLWKEREW